MAGTFSQIYIQIVFSVRGRDSLIGDEWKDELCRYMSGIIDNKGHKAIVVNGVSDHVHMFVGLRPAMSISDLVRDVKNNSSNFVNDNQFSRGKFEWQEGYGAFSYSHSQIEHVYNYISNQEEHHKVKTFKQEYEEFLNKFQVKYDSKYLVDEGE